MGDKVCAVLLAGGAFAEEAVANQNAVFPLPPGSDEVAAAGLPVAYGAFAVQHVQKLEVSFSLLCCFLSLSVSLLAFLSCALRKVQKYGSAHLISGHVVGNASSTVTFRLQNLSDLVPS
jgi:hypothetical protein